MKNSILQITSSISIVLCFAICCLAQQTADDLVNTLKPAMDMQTVGMLNIDLERASFDDLFNPIMESFDEASIERAQMKESAIEYSTAFGLLKKSGAKRLNVLFKLGTLVKSDYMIALECDDEQAAKRVAGVLGDDLRGFMGLYPTVKSSGANVYVNSSDTGRPNWAEDTVDPPKWSAQHDAKDLAQFAAAIGKAKDAPIRLAFVLSADQKRALVELNPDAFAAGGIGSASSIEHLQSISVAITPGEQIQVWIETATPNSIKAMATKASESLLAISNLPGLKKNLGKFSEWLATIPGQFKIEKSTASLNLSGEKLTEAYRGISGPIFQVVRKQRYSRTIAKIREVVIAFHNYHDVNGTFPPAYSVDANGKPLLSWRVLILPYLNHDFLYKQFKLDEPWDSKANRLAASTAIPVYGWNWQAANGQHTTTRIQAVSCKGSAMSVDGMSLKDITDGTSGTIAVMEVASGQAVEWSKPGDFEMDGGDLINRLVNEGSTGFWTGFCDASIHFIPKTIDSAQLKLLMQANDGEIVDMNVGMAPAAADPDYDPLSELPSFWFNDLVPQMWIISGVQ